MESGSGAFHSFKCWRAVIKSPVRNSQRYSLGFVLCPAKDQKPLKKQVEMTSDQRPLISHIESTEMQ